MIIALKLKNDISKNINFQYMQIYEMYMKYDNKDFKDLFRILLNSMMKTIVQDDNFHFL